MKKKKLAVFLLVMVMVLSLAVTALVGCDPKDEDSNTPPKGYKAMTEALGESLSAILKNSVDGHYLNEIKIQANLDAKTYLKGVETANYRISFGAEVSLDPETDSKNRAGLSITDTKANKNILTAYYNEELGAGVGEYLYVEIGSGNDSKVYGLKAVGVTDTLTNTGASVNPDKGKELNNTVYNSINKIMGTLDLVGGVVSTYQSSNNNEILVRIDLQKLLKENKQLLPVIDEYTKAIGLDLNSKNIAKSLPGLVLDIKIQLEGAEANDFENAVITGVSADFSVNKKDVKINRTDGTSFVRLNITDKCAVDLGLDFKFDPATVTVPRVSNASINRAVRMNAIDFEFSGELDLKEGIGYSLNLFGEETTLAIPKGDYLIKVGVSLDPTKLINGLSSPNTLHGLLDMIGNIVTNVVSKLSIEIVDKSNPEDESKQLSAQIEDGTLSLKNLNLLGELGETLTKALGGAEVKVPSVITVVKKYVADKVIKEDPKGEEDSNTPSGAPSGDEDVDDDDDDDDDDEEEKTPFGETDLAKTLAALIKNLTINFDGKTAHADVKDQTLKENIKYRWKEVTLEDGKSGWVLDPDENGNAVVIKDFKPTTLDATLDITKTGIKLHADIKNIIMDQDKKLETDPNLEKSTDITADINIDFEKGTIEISAKATNFELDGKPFPIDLVIKIDMKDFKFGVVNTWGNKA